MVGGGCDVIFNITEGGLELIFLFWRGGYCLSFCQITLVFQPPLLIIIAQSLRAKCWLRGVVSGQYNDPKLVSMVITLEPLE